MGTRSFRQTAAIKSGFAGSGQTVGTLVRGWASARSMSSNSGVPINLSVRDAKKLGLVCRKVGTRANSPQSIAGGF